MFNPALNTMTKYLFISAMIQYLKQPLSQLLLYCLFLRIYRYNLYDEVLVTHSLEIRLDQKPVHHCCPAENRPLPASGQLSPPYRTRTVSSVSLLRRRWWYGAASSTLLPVTHAGMNNHQLHRLNRSSMHVSGPSWKRSGPWHAPRQGMRDREAFNLMQKYSEDTCHFVRMWQCDVLLSGVRGVIRPSNVLYTSASS